jgi:hypothetical protein
MIRKGQKKLEKTLKKVWWRKLSTVSLSSLAFKKRGGKKFFELLMK